MFVYQLIYSSQPFGFDESILISLLMDARRQNAKNNVTGALICRADIYLQLLEGPKSSVDETMARIERDDRHVNIQIHVSERSAERIFPEWAMLHDPEASWHWSPDEVAAGALTEASPAQFREIFQGLATKAQSPA